jgi:repressor LexA
VSLLTIGIKIKNARLKKGLTQEQLGELVGVQKSAIAKYENGKIVNIKRSTIQKLVSALDMRMSDFIFDESPVESADLHVRIISDMELMSALKCYYELSADNQKVIRDLIMRLK